jgi:ferritin
MLSKKMAEALNAQINKEMSSAYLYMAMSAHCSSLNLSGFAKWLMSQYHEEMFHAMKMYKYLIDQGAAVELDTIEAQKSDFGTPLQVMEQVQAHEKKVTKSIWDLYEVAVKEKDLATQIFVQWYVTEQVEEESNAADLIAKFKMAGEKGASLIMVDVHLGSREVKVPTNFVNM